MLNQHQANIQKLSALVDINCRVAIRPEGNQEFGQRVCFYGAKSTEGLNAECTVWPCDVGTGEHEIYNQKQKSKRLVLVLCGWTPETFQQYLDMLRDIYPRSIPMLAETCWERPVIRLSDPAAAARFITWCYFRALWECPSVGHMLLNAWLNGKQCPEIQLHPFEYVMLGSRVIANQNHWFAYLPTKRQLSVQDTLDKYFNPQSKTLSTSVDKLIGFPATYTYGHTDARDVPQPIGLSKSFSQAEFITWCDQYFWKCERHNYMKGE